MALITGPYGVYTQIVAPGESKRVQFMNATQVEAITQVAQPAPDEEGPVSYRSGFGFDVDLSGSAFGFWAKPDNHKNQDLAAHVIDMPGNGTAAPVAAGPKTVALSRSSVVGAVAEGAVAVAILNDGTADGTVLGVVLKANGVVEWSAPDGETLPVIAYDGTGTDLLISELR